MFFVGGCFLSLSTAGHRRLALSTHAFKVFKHQKALPMVLFYSYLVFLQIINGAPKS